MTAAALAIHGGAGLVSRDALDEARERACREALTAIVNAVWARLDAGASAVDAVEEAVVRLEDCELFNAGRGAVLNEHGHVELDASIMDGATRAAGAVAAVRTIKNPVIGARRIMNEGQHVLLVGDGAEAMARRCGLECVDNAYFITEERSRQLAAAREASSVDLDHGAGYGTVGAVACDRQGRLAAATSTGGMTNQRAGRVGDSPLIGAGTWADSRVCAVSATGHGEMLIRCAMAHSVYARMTHGGLDLEKAAGEALKELGWLGGAGGLIAVDYRGNLALPFNTAGMFRAWANGRGPSQAAIFAD